MIVPLFLFSVSRGWITNHLTPLAQIRASDSGYGSFSDISGKPPAAHHLTLGTQTTFNILARVQAITSLDTTIACRVTNRAATLVKEVQGIHMSCC
jgi:hypothetical protein